MRNPYEQLHIFLKNRSYIHWWKFNTMIEYFQYKTEKTQNAAGNLIFLFQAQNDVQIFRSYLCPQSDTISFCNWTRENKSLQTCSFFHFYDKLKKRSVLQKFEIFWNFDISVERILENFANELVLKIMWKL